MMTLGMLTELSGQRSLGTLLGLGPERDLGGSYLVRLSGVYPFQIGKPLKARPGVDYSVSIICPVANVLVWESITFRPRKESVCILII